MKELVLYLLFFFFMLTKIRTRVAMFDFFPSNYVLAINAYEDKYVCNVRVCMCACMCDCMYHY